MSQNLKKFNQEITDILAQLDNLQTGSFYENTENPHTPSAQTIARNIKKQFSDLIEKIQTELN